jgi:hypothetical protein
MGSLGAYRSIVYSDRHATPATGWNWARLLKRRDAGRCWSSCQFFGVPSSQNGTIDGRLHRKSLSFKIKKHCGERVRSGLTLLMPSLYLGRRSVISECKRQCRPVRRVPPGVGNRGNTIESLACDGHPLRWPLSFLAPISPSLCVICFSEQGSESNLAPLLRVG